MSFPKTRFDLPEIAGKNAFLDATNDIKGRTGTSCVTHTPEKWEETVDAFGLYWFDDNQTKQSWETIELPLKDLIRSLLTSSLQERERETWEKLEAMKITGKITEAEYLYNHTLSAAQDS